MKNTFIESFAVLNYSSKRKITILFLGTILLLTACLHDRPTPPPPPAPPLAPADNPPAVSIISHVDGEAVSGIVVLEASVSDDTGITHFTFSVEGETLPPDAAEPNKSVWESFDVFDGSYTVRASATDTAGQITFIEIELIAQNDDVTKFDVSFGPYEGDQDPNHNSTISEDQIRRKARQLRHSASMLRTFSSNENASLDAVPRIADEFRMCVAVGIWLDSNTATNNAEIEKGIETARTGCVRYIIVGSEALLRGDLTLEQLLGYIEQVKLAIPGVLVTTGEIYPNWINNPELVDVVDVLFVNFYPFWEGIVIDRAIGALNFYYNEVAAIADGKEVIVSETGWPSCGDPVGNAVPSEENAAFYFMNYASWLDATGVTGFYFEAFDEPWKGNYGEGSRGACWGIRYEDGTLKPGVQAVFDGERMEDNWTVVGGIPGGPGTPSIEFTYVPPYRSFDNVVGLVQHVDPTEYAVVLYINVRDSKPDRWWVKPFANQPLTNIAFDGTFIVDYTTGGIDDRAREFHAFLIPRTYSPPILLGADEIPQELFNNAVADIKVRR